GTGTPETETGTGTGTPETETGTPEAETGTPEAGTGTPETEAGTGTGTGTPETEAGTGTEATIAKTTLETILQTTAKNTEVKDKFHQLKSLFRQVQLEIQHNSGNSDLLNLFNLALKAAGKAELKPEQFTADQIDSSGKKLPNEQKFVNYDFKTALQDIIKSPGALKALVEDPKWATYKEGLESISKKEKPVRLEDVVLTEAERGKSKEDRRKLMADKVIEPSTHICPSSATKMQDYLQEVMSLKVEGTSTSIRDKASGTMGEFTIQGLDGTSTTFTLPLPTIGQSDVEYAKKVNEAVSNITKPPFNAGIATTAIMTKDATGNVISIKTGPNLVNGFAASIGLTSISFKKPIQAGEDRSVGAIMRKIRNLELDDFELKTIKKDGKEETINKDDNEFKNKLQKHRDLVIGGVVCKQADLVKALISKAKDEVCL
ncbi:MAG: hypothetical protein ACJAZX_001485, partial [Rickettsiales bacterium]